MIVWYGTELYKRRFCPDAQLANGPSTSMEAERIVIEASPDSAQRTERRGLRWLQKFRRDTRSLAPALVCSFETRKSLALLFPMLEEGMPGTGFLRFPFTQHEFEIAHSQLQPLTPQELVELLRWRAGLQEEWYVYSHDLGNMLTDWERNRVPGEALLERWAASIQAFAPDQLPAFEALQANLSMAPDQSRAALQALDEGLRIRSTTATSRASDAVPPAPYARPPWNYDSIAVMDDSGYEAATIGQLKQLGYRVFGPALRPEAAERLLRNASPHIVLADLHFPQEADGLAVMQRALATPSVRLVIAISHARLNAAALPAGVENGSGAYDFQDAERIHRLIWRHATAQGIHHHA